MRNIILVIAYDTLCIIGSRMDIFRVQLKKKKKHQYRPHVDAVLKVTGFVYFQRVNEQQIVK